MDERSLAVDLTLRDIVESSRRSLGILHKQDIQLAAHYLDRDRRSTSSAGLTAAFNPKKPKVDTDALPGLGDDCAVIPQGEGYLLLAAEGMLPSLVAAEPWFAGWCAVMVNVSDIYAMGGTPIAVVDALWSPSPEDSKDLWEGMQAAAAAYGVPIVGGHTNCHSPYAALSVAILGQASHLLSSFKARSGDVLLMAVDLRGQQYAHYPFWNAATEADPQRLRDDLALLPDLAARGWCDAAKDISMGGVLGTTLMLIETSGCGAHVELDAIPKPDGLALSAWLEHFPSYGFVLSVRPEFVESVQAAFQQRDLCCEPIGTVNASHALTLAYGDDRATLWDLADRPLMGWSPRSRPAKEASR